VVILNSWLPNFTGCQPGVFFLGIKKDGTYRISKSTPECIDRKISIKKDRIEITATPDVHTTEQMYLPIPGGKWVYRNGELHTIRYIELPDPRRKKKAAERSTCTGAAEAQILWLLSMPLGGPMMSIVMRLRSHRKGEV
jgi:hypothetical protein